MRELSPPTARWIDSPDAPDGEDLSGLARVRVTHPFHPWAGRELEFVERRRNWRADRVHQYVRDPAASWSRWPRSGRTRSRRIRSSSLPGGRAPFHLDGLLSVAGLVGSGAAMRRSPGKRGGGG
jgi:hypothetical protein